MDDEERQTLPSDDADLRASIRWRNRRVRVMATEDAGLDEVPPEPHYKVERELREGFPRARKRQPSGVSADLRIYFREDRDGKLWGGVGMYDESGDRIEYMALDSKAGLQWLLKDVLCDVGFEAAPRERTKPRTE